MKTNKIKNTVITVLLTLALSFPALHGLYQLDDKAYSLKLLSRALLGEAVEVDAGPLLRGYADFIDMVAHIPRARIAVLTDAMVLVMQTSPLNTVVPATKIVASTVLVYQTRLGTEPFSQFVGFEVFDIPSFQFRIHLARNGKQNNRKQDTEFHVGLSCPIGLYAQETVNFYLNPI